MASACSVRVVLLRLAGDVRINCNSRLLDLVDVLVLLAAVAVALVCDQVFRSGALSLTVVLSCACCLLRILLLVIILLLSGRSSCTIFGGVSTLRTSGKGTLGTSRVSLVMLLVIRLSARPNGCIVCTLRSAWVMPSRCYALVCGAGFTDLVMAVFFLTAFSVSCSSCCISSAPLLPPIFLIALVQSDMAAIIVLAWLMVGFVIILWLN